MGEEARNSYMKDVKDILDRSGRSIETIINDLKQKSTTPPAWSELKKVLDPKEHKIVDDKQSRPDKVIQTDKGTRIEEAARNAISLEMLLVERINEFAFTLPVVREYEGVDTPTRQDIKRAIDKIYEEADIDNVNLDRGEAYFSACEIFTLWYTVKKPHTRYGFNAKHKLKCRFWSPKDDNVELYPLLDEYGDMIAMSVYYERKIDDKHTTKFFETWTSDKHYKWKDEGDGWVDEIFYEDGEGNKTYGDDISIMKIPGVYAWRKKPTYKDGTPDLRNDVEYIHSRDTDVLAYNSAPVLKIAGAIEGSEEKGETRRVYRVENGGDVSYVGWNQSTEATDKHIQRDIDWFWMLNQMPDISFKNLQSLGDIGYDARQMMLTDAYLRVNKEVKPLVQMFRREGNIIKAFLKEMNNKWTQEDLDAVTIKYKVQVYIPKDEDSEIEKRMKANGGQPIESQRESIERFGKSLDVDATLKEIQEETKKRSEVTIGSVFEGAE